MSLVAKRGDVRISDISAFNPRPPVKPVLIGALNELDSERQAADEDERV
jgi:hypothetical protein